MAVVVATRLLLADINHDFADSLFSHGFYREAVSEYRRYLLDADRATDTALLKLGLSLAVSGSLPEAAEVMHQVSELSPRLAQPSLLALAGFYVRAGELARARVEVSDLLLFVSDSAERHALRAHRAWIALQEHDFRSAHADLFEANRASTLGDDSPGGYRSSAVAVLLSSLVPGIGEIYAGQVGTGLLSFLVTASTGAATYWSVRSGDWATAAMIFSVLFLRFYNGSRRNAADFVDEYNDRRAQAFAARVIAEQRLQPDWFQGVRALTRPGFPEETESALTRRPSPP